LLANLTVDTSPAIGTAEDDVLSYSAPANTLTAGTVLRITATGVRTGTNNSGATARVRIGPTTLTGASVAAVPHPSSNLGGGTVSVEFLVTVRTTGVSGSARGGGQMFYDTVQGSDTNAAIVVDTTVANLIELTFQTANAANTVVFPHAVLVKL
jgi:hypothetical protein